MNEVMEGEATQAQIGGLLVALRLKGETADEIAGCAEAMRAHVLSVRPKRDDLVDTAGTGGDGGAHDQHLDRGGARGGGGGRRGREARQPRGLVGVRARRTCSRRWASGWSCRLHGSSARSTSSASASCSRRRTTRRCATRAPVRRELAARTVFNVLGPLDEPRRAPGAGGRRLRALAGANDRRGARPAGRPASVRRPRRGRDRRALADGPESRLRGRRRRVREREIDPLELGVPALRPGRAARRLARPRTPRRSAPSSRGEDGGRRSAILLNAAGAIAAAGHGRDLREGLELAREAVDSGAAAVRLEALAAFSAGNGGARPDGALPLRARGSGLAAIAEVKRRSPSAGDLRPDADPAALAAAVRARRRGGGLDPRRRTLRRHRSTTSGPARGRRRCRCSPRASSREPDELAELRDAGRRRGAAAAARPRRRRRAAPDGKPPTELGLDALVEAHDAGELRRAVELGADPIGINARDLSTFAIDRRAQLALVEAGSARTASVVAESGIAAARPRRRGRARGRAGRAGRLGADAGTRSLVEARRVDLAPARQGLRSDARGGRRRRRRRGCRPRGLRARGGDAAALAEGAGRSRHDALRGRPRRRGDRRRRGPRPARTRARTAIAPETACCCAAGARWQRCVDLPWARAPIRGHLERAGAAEGRIVLAGGLLGRERPGGDRAGPALGRRRELQPRDRRRASRITRAVRAYVEAARCS